MKKYFDSQSVHSQGNCDLSVIDSGILYSIGSDNQIFQKELTTNQQKKVLLTAFTEGCSALSCARYNNQNLIAIASGNKIYLIKNIDKQQIEELWELKSKIVQIAFSISGRYLGIAIESGEIGLYNFQDKTMILCPSPFTASSLSVFFSNNQKYLCSTGKDGYIKVYNIQQENSKNPCLKTQYKIVKTINNDFQILQGMFNPQDTLIACPGRNFLQILGLQNRRFQEQFKTSISHQKQIFLCYWINNDYILTIGFDITMKIWDYKRETLFINIQQSYFTKIVPYNNTFYGINHSGIIHKFSSPQILFKKENENKSKAPSQVDFKSNKKNIENEYVDVDAQQSNDNSKPSSRKSDGDQDIQAIDDLEQNDAEIQSQVSLKQVQIKKTKSKASRIINCFPQQAIHKSTDYFANARFLYYNTIGCIIEKVDGTTNIIEVEYHNASVANQRKSIFNDRQMMFFDIGVNRVLYANKRQYGYFGDCFWENKLQQNDDQTIQGVSLGNEWIAIALQSRIMIFDLAGNFVNNISFDKKFVVMTSYQDILVVAYIDSVPMYGCQNIRMNIWNINGNIPPLQNICVTVKPLSILKSFGFSEEGLLYSEDSKDHVRVYSFNSNKWIDIFHPNNSQQTTGSKYWIIGMSNFELNAFKLAQGQLQPTVFPRHVTRTVDVFVPNFLKHQITQNSTNQYLQFGVILWKKLILQHQRYRYRYWYRYKFARTQQNANFNKSNNILSDEELNTKQSILDQQITELVQKLVTQKQVQRAYLTAKTFVKSQKQLNNLLTLFKQSNLKQQANKLQEYYDEIARLQQYDLAYKLKLKSIHQSMVQQSKVKVFDIMNPNYKKPTQIKNQTKSIKSTIHQKQNKHQNLSENQKQSSNSPQKQKETQKHYQKKSQQYHIPSQPQIQSTQTTQSQNQGSNFEIKNPFLRVCDPIQQLVTIQGEIQKRKTSVLTKNEQKPKSSIKTSISQIQAFKK